MHSTQTLTIALTIIFSHAHSATCAQDALERLVASLPADVREVSSGGRWRTNNGGGIYRVVVVRGGYERITDRLYIQWIRQGDGGEQEVAATIGVTEINDAGPVTLSQSIQPEGTNQLRIVVNIHNSAARQRARMIVVATTPAKYSARARTSSRDP